MRIILSDKDRDEFLKNIANPPKANEKLREILKPYMEKSGKNLDNTQDTKA